MNEPTYRITLDDEGRERITCLVCGRTSYHPEDVRRRYCGNCHRFHEEPTCMTKDPYDDPEFRDWVKRELVPKIKGSSVVASVICDPDGVDIKFAVELGLSVILGKPIIGCMTPGVKISEKLALVVDRFVEVDLSNPESTKDAVAEAMKELLGDQFP